LVVRDAAEPPGPKIKHRLLISPTVFITKGPCATTGSSIGSPDRTSKLSVRVIRVSASSVGLLEGSA
jgi:hypothetical protein